MTKVFLDSAYLIALVSTSDKFHLKANQLSRWLIDSQVEIVTTRAVLLEVGNALSKERYRHIAVELLSRIERNINIEIVPLSERLYTEAVALFKSRSDKEWGLVDCVSYVAMTEQGITQVLTSDKHFKQMGFEAMLLDD